MRSIDDVDRIISASYKTPQIIFKHSTRCFISSMVLRRLEDEWNYTNEEYIPNFLDIIAYRDVSAYIAERLKVHHESPQILLINNGEAIFDESHQGISAGELRTISLV
jgi:bacillithiol system protein YtxJ